MIFYILLIQSLEAGQSESNLKFNNFAELPRCNSNLNGGRTVPDSIMKTMLDEMIDKSLCFLHF